MSGKVLSVRSRFVTDLRRYWPLLLVYVLAVLTMHMGALHLRDDHHRWAYVWIVAVGAVAFVSVTLLKRRIECTMLQNGGLRCL